MIIIKLLGGLGNQMFQYAAGKSLANKLETSLFLDLSFYNQIFDKNTERKYELNYFNLKVSKLSNFQNKIINWGANKNIFVNKYNEKNINFDKNFFTLKGNLVLNGYFQSEKYFHNIEKLVRKDFGFRNKINKKAKKLLKKIKATNSVSLHIRRGDYLTNKAARKTHGVCSTTYYKKAAEKITTMINRVVFYVFSDDIDWCRNNLKFINNIVFVENNKNWEDLKLMSICKHNIIANSSFSWWAAWLNKNKKKVVIAPKKWFLKNEVKIEDRFPRKWIVF